MALKITELKVADYMTPNPISVGQTFPFKDAIGIMEDKEIGNLVVKEDHAVKGIFTEREILQYITSYGEIPEIQMRDVLLQTFTGISLDTTLISAAKMMILKKARLLVFVNRKLVGIVTASDMLRGFRKTVVNPSLEKVISTKIYQCKHDDSIIDATKIMDEKRVGSVIVTKNGDPYGIFTERDLLVNVLSNEVDLKSKVGGYCTSPLITTKIGIGGNESANLMAKKKIKRLVLTDKNKIVGIVTARDIVDAFQMAENL
ncbi:MAG TPA: CBS domain-containing protein [Nitrosopumilaceae archaeon]|nr:CBS domain-containing protein [Nitrosopumilaceae archaeon]